MKTTDELLMLIPKNMILGRTLFQEEEKKFLVCHEAWLLSEYILDLQFENYDLIKYQHDAEDHKVYFYGATPNEALQKCYDFYVGHKKKLYYQCEIN